MKKIFFTYILLCFAIILVAQEQLNNNYLHKIIEEDKNHIVACKVVDGDSLFIVNMRPILVYPPRKFKNKREKRRYNRMIRNVKKVYPYALTINNIFYESENHLKTLDNKKEKRKYIKHKEKELKKQFEKTIRNMTFTQGRILIKLVDRETGHTSYQLVKHFKGSVSAVLWQSVALIFSTNLKYEYDPENEDKWIEEIVSRIENGQL